MTRHHKTDHSSSSLCCIKPMGLRFFKVAFCDLEACNSDKAKLISIAPTQWYVFEETDTISCARISGKIKVAIVEGNLVWRLPIDIFESNLYHTNAIFCWSSLAQRSATLRSHSRLISNECFHRRNASSCVIFLISIMAIHLISAAKLRIISE